MSLVKPTRAPNNVVPLRAGQAIPARSDLEVRLLRAFGAIHNPYVREEFVAWIEQHARKAEDCAD